MEAFFYAIWQINNINKFTCYSFYYNFINYVYIWLILLTFQIMFLESPKLLNYTDDTAMSIGVASSLVKKGEIDAKDMAER